MFVLHERLAADTTQIADFPLSRVLLMNDARYPWIIMVPRQNGLKELHELSEGDGIQLWKEIKTASKFMEATFDCDKVNVGALGNLVPQLHIHIIARKVDDAAWPGPVWGVGQAEGYTSNALENLKNQLVTGLNDAI